MSCTTIKLCFILCSILLLPSFVISQYYGGEDGKKLDWALFYLSNHYVDSVDTKPIAEVALRAIAAELDPYSVYQTAEQLRKQKQADNGIQTIGVGLKLIVLDEKPYITNVFPNSPAAQNDIRVGDIIDKIDGRSLAGIDADSISRLLIGEYNTAVSMRLQRDNSSLTKELMRQRIPLVSVEAAFKVDLAIGLIKLRRFTIKTVEEFHSAMEKLRAAGANDIIIDMRGNNGGVFTAAVELASQFLPEGSLIVYTDGHMTEREDHISKIDGPYQNGKIVVLTDGVTASSSEVFIGALQDWDRVMVIGTPSFGKGLIQQSYGFSDSSALRITIGKYFRPSGQSVQNSSKKPLILPNTICVGCETRQYVDEENVTHQTMSGRALYSLGAGIVPDVLHKGAAYERPDLRYRVVARHYFDQKKKLDANLRSVPEIMANRDLDQFISLKDPGISTRNRIEAKGWLAALLLDTEAYYEVKSYQDHTIGEALKRLKDSSFKQFGITY